MDTKVIFNLKKWIRDENEDGNGYVGTSLLPVRIHVLGMSNNSIIYILCNIYYLINLLLLFVFVIQVHNHVIVGFLLQKLLGHD